MTAYALPYLVLMPLYGTISDRMPPRLVFFGALAVFCVGTGICLAARQLPVLVLGRVIQGLGGAAVHPLSLSLLTQSVPLERRGAAMGSWNSAGPAASIVGPLSAGGLIESFGWRSIFLVTAGAAAVALVGIWLLLPRTARAGGTVQGGFDLPGALLLAASVSAIVCFVSSEPVTGVPALSDWRLLLAAVVSVGAFVLSWSAARQPRC